mmetsp:Transcript_32557/g.56338  ORF Transcript_32557/g.56338 Transcript_32557/m.56338 type:complete len:501 (-) Transcript_32557:1399-2901(-)
MAGNLWREHIRQAEPDVIGRLEMLQITHNIGEEAFANAVLAVAFNNDGVFREADLNRVQKDISRQVAKPVVRSTPIPRLSVSDLVVEHKFCKGDNEQLDPKTANGEPEYDFNPAGNEAQRLHYENMIKWAGISKQKRLEKFKEIFQIQYTVEERLTKHSETPVTVVGRIITMNDEQLSQENLMLETTHDRIKLNVDRLSGYWLFPGQIVAVTGTCDSTCFYAQEIKSGLQCPYKELSPSQAEDYSFSLHSSPLKVLVARGPFTGNEDFDYKGLHALVNHANAKRYHTVILLGPFLSIRHKHISRGVCKSIHSKSDATFEECFLHMIDFLNSSLDNSKVILVPSLLDAFVDLPLPQPGFVHQKVQVTENPCNLTINGLQISIANYDIIKEVLMQSVLRSSAPINKNEVVVRQLLEQQSLMPLLKGFPVDWHYAKHFDLHYSPDLLIVGSSLGMHFQEVSNTLSLFTKPCTERQVMFYDLSIQSGLAPLPERIFAKACSLKV